MTNRAIARFLVGTCAVLAGGLTSGEALAKHTASRIVYGSESLYVTLKGLDRVYVIDRASQKLVETVKVDSPPCGGFITKDGSFFIALGEADAIAIVDTKTNSVRGRIDLKDGGHAYMDPGGMAMSPDGTRIYVANESGNSLSVIDVATRKVIRQIPLGEGPQNIALTPDGGLALVTDFHSVRFVDTVSLSTKGEIVLRDPATDAARTVILADGEEVIHGPRDVLVGPSGAEAYVAVEDTGEIAVIDVRARRVAQFVKVGPYPGGLALSADGKFLFIAHRDSTEISILDTAGRKVVRRVKVGQDPWAITLSPDGRNAYVVNQASKSISVIDTDNHSVMATIFLLTKKILPRGLRRLLFVWRKQRRKQRYIPFMVAIFGALFLVPFTLSFVDQVTGSGGAHAEIGKATGQPTTGVFGSGRRLAFESKRSGTWEIYSMSADGSDQLRLTNTQANNRSPLWFPNGTRMLFVSDRDGNQELYVMEQNGQHQENLTRSAGNDFSPAVSPDGRRIAFVSTRDGKRDIYIMGADGGPSVRLTTAGDNWNPNWSPTGDSIAFVSRRDGNNEIYEMKPDGRDQVNLTRHPGEDGRGSHAWSPDGKRIAWVTNRDGNWEIYVMNKDGSNPVNITHNPAEEGIGMFIWSPNGKQIAFISTRDSNEEVYIVNADGSGTVNLSRSPAMDDIPFWSPDGQHVAFVSNRTGYDEIYVMEADGNHQVQLTFSRSKEDFPRWQP